MPRSTFQTGQKGIMLKKEKSKILLPKVQQPKSGSTLCVTRTIILQGFNVRNDCSGDSKTLADKMKRKQQGI